MRRDYILGTKVVPEIDIQPTLVGIILPLLLLISIVTRFMRRRREYSIWSYHFPLFLTPRFERDVRHAGLRIEEGIPTSYNYTDPPSENLRHKSHELCPSPRQIVEKTI